MCINSKTRENLTNDSKMKKEDKKFRYCMTVKRKCRGRISARRKQEESERGKVKKQVKMVQRRVGREMCYNVLKNKKEERKGSDRKEKKTKCGKRIEKGRGRRI